MRRSRVHGISYWYREGRGWYADFRKLGGGRESLGIAEEDAREERLHDAVWLRKREILDGDATPLEEGVTLPELVRSVNTRLERLEAAIQERKPSYPSRCPTCGWVGAQVSVLRPPHANETPMYPKLPDEAVRMLQPGEKVLRAECDRCGERYHVPARPEE